MNEELVKIMRSDGSYKDIGLIKPKKTVVYETGILEVDQFNKEMLNFIRSDKGYKKTKVINAADIQGFIFRIMRWRRCTAYLVVQTSRFGTRYLCYMYDKIKHHGQSFGTSSNMVKKSEIVNEFKKTCADYDSSVPFGIE